MRAWLRCPSSRRRGERAPAYESAGGGDEPVSPPARAQPGGLVSVGRRGLRAGAEGGQAGPALRGLLGLPLVPRDGARVLRERGHRRAHEPALRQHQGGPRGAPRRRPDLHAGRAVHDGPGRLADDRIPHSRRHAVLRRHVFPAGGPPRDARLPATARIDRRRLPVAARRGGGVRAAAPRGDAPGRAAQALGELAHRGRRPRRLPGPRGPVRRAPRRAWPGAEVPSADDLGVRVARLEAHGRSARAQPWSG